MLNWEVFQILPRFRFVIFMIFLWIETDYRLKFESLTKCQVTLLIIRLPTFRNVYEVKYV